MGSYEYFNTRQPPQILHSAPRPADYRERIRAAARNIHLRKQSIALLLCYAGHANTFRPAAETITRETGIAGNKISEVRKRLVERGVIAYREYPGFILIDWHRISVFARL